MRVLVQRSKNSKVTINGKVNGKIDKGFVLLAGGADKILLDVKCGNGALMQNKEAEHSRYSC